MELGKVVEFIDSQKIHCAVVMDIKNLRLRLLTENNREVKLAVARLHHKSDRHLDLAMGRDKLVSQLKEIAAHRRSLSEQVDVQALWEILNTEQEWIDLVTMTALCFPEDTDGDHESAVIRAFFSDRLYFKFNPDRVFPHTDAQVDQIIAKREAAAFQERLIGRGADWLQKVLDGQIPPAPDEADAITEMLASYYLFEKESPHRDTAKALLKKAGVGSPAAILSFMVKTKVWSAHVNLDLLRYGISPELPIDVETHAAALCRNATVVLNGRRDLRELPLITIDGPSTQDFDDALSITKQGDHYILGIHITDVGYFVTKDDPIDREAQERASSIYMPDQKISMLPGTLCEDACSLRAGQDRPAISTLVHITPQAKIIDYEIVPSLIRVKEQLTFQDVDQMVTQDEDIRCMHTIALNYRQHRLNNGALIIDLPEINVWLQPDGSPMVASTNRESPGRMLVAELMILCNELTARFLAERDLPAIFRSQPEPRERLFDNNQGTLFQNWMQRKAISRFVLSSTPERHSGLGLPGYVTATSPIRKFSDLVTQRQLRAAAGMEAAYSKEQVDYFIAALDEPMGQIGRVQHRRHRYWLLKYLESRTGRKEEALVLFKRRDRYVVLLQPYLLECNLSGAEGITLRPEDLVQVTFQHVNARNDVFTVVFG